MSPPGATPQQKVPSSAPFLSIVLTGRNDEYGGDFQTRFLRALAFNTRELAARGIPYEVVFVEWAPDPQRPLLVDLVVDTIGALRDSGTFRGIVVDRAYHDALSLNPRLEYLEFLAKNVGIRRAAGEYVLTTNCDVLFSRTVLDEITNAESRLKRAVSPLAFGLTWPPAVTLATSELLRA